MNKLIALFFLNSYLFSLVQVTELLKIPFLVEHFLEHQSGKPEMNLLEFLSIHYTHNDVKDTDYEKDMKLPFKSQNQVNVFSDITFFQINLNFKSQNTFVLIDKKINFFKYNFSFIAQFLSSIWQPPKAIFTV